MNNANETMTKPETDARNGRPRGWAAQATAYVTAIIAAIAVLIQWRELNPLLALFIADVAATCVIFAFSVTFNNSSLYDPYWSVQPIMLALFWLVVNGEADANTLRATVVTALVVIWGVRLTANFLYGWKGLAQEDWRYQDLRQQTGRAYWLVSFLGIQLLPTILVYLGCIPLMSALWSGTAPLNLLDAVAFLITSAAIYLETVSDLQLHRFAKSTRAEPKTLDTGLWARSRHPNYMGELLFWWGLALFGLSAGGGGLAVIGAIAITALFVFISIPMIEKRHLKRRQDYPAYQKQVPMLIPRLRGLKNSNN